MASFIEQPIFICGHPKAGTSLITALLDGHPAIVAYPEETLFFRRFLPAIQGKSLNDQIDLARKLLIYFFEWNQESPPEHQQDYPDRDYSNISFEAVYEKMIEALPRQDVKTSDFLNAVIIAFGQVMGLLTKKSKCWVEKSPYNEYYANVIFEWWPNAKCIHIVRDPRDNFISYQRKHPRWNAKVFTWNWVRSTHAGILNYYSYGDERYTLLRFEDLLTDPEKIMRQMAQFLELPWDPALLKPTRAGAQWQGNSMFAEKYQKISTTPLGRWQELIDPFDLAIIQTIGKDVMSALRYECVKIDNQDFDLKQKLSIFREKINSWIKQHK